MRILYKIVFIGDGGVGKTSTIRSIYKYISKKYDDASFKSCQDESFDYLKVDRTKFIDFHTITMQSPVKTVLQIWDLQGQRFPSNKAYTSLNPLDHITETVVKNADLILLTYDITNNATFNELFRENGFFDLIRPYLLQDQKILLLANKTDLLKEKIGNGIEKIDISAIEHNILASISYNNTFYENISVIVEKMFSLLNICNDNQILVNRIPAGGEISLKVYK